MLHVKHYYYAIKNIGHHMHAHLKEKEHLFCHMYQA